MPWRRDRLPAPVFLGFPGGSAGKESARKAGDLASIPGSGRCPGGGIGYSLQCSSLENAMDRGAGGLQSTGSHMTERLSTQHRQDRVSPHREERLVPGADLGPNKGLSSAHHLCSRGRPRLGARGLRPVWEARPVARSSGTRSRPLC